MAPHCYKKLSTNKTLIIFFGHFKSFVTSKKILPPYFLLKIKFSASSRFWAHVFKKVFRGLLSNHDIQWVKLTKTPHIHTKFYILGNFSGVRKWRNSISKSYKTEIFIYNVPFTLHSLVQLIPNSTNAKEQQNLTSQCLQNRASKLALSLSEHQKSRGLSVFAHMCIVPAFCYRSSHMEL